MFKENPGECFQAISSIDLGDDKYPYLRSVARNFVADAAVCSIPFVHNGESENRYRQLVLMRSSMLGRTPG